MKHITGRSTQLFLHTHAVMLVLLAALASVCAGIALGALTSSIAYADETRTVVDTQGNEISVPAAPAAPEDGLTPADNCSITLEYFEIVHYEDPDKPVGTDKLHLMGTRTLDGFQEGETVSIWPYVVDIPGHFFWDGWPASLTVLRDPSQNVFTLNYFLLSNAEYTVNYYVMTGADLTAGTWTEALAPENVKFTKMGSEKFTNQRFDALIKGDAYEYKLDNMYVIDTYPSEIRLGTNPDNNVINVLYVPGLSTLPDDVEITEKPSYDDQMTTLPDKVEIPDEQFNYDDLITTLPDDVYVEDFASTEIIDPDEDTTIEITDEMLAHPVDKAQAEETINAYLTGVEQAKTLSHTSDTTFGVVCAIAGIAVVAAVVLGVMVYRRRKN